MVLQELTWISAIKSDQYKQLATSRAVLQVDSACIERFVDLSYAEQDFDAEIERSRTCLKRRLKE